MKFVENCFRTNKVLIYIPRTVLTLHSNHHRSAGILFTHRLWRALNLQMLLFVPFLLLFFGILESERRGNGEKGMVITLARHSRTLCAAHAKRLGSNRSYLKPSEAFKAVPCNSNLVMVTSFPSRMNGDIQGNNGKLKKR